MQSCVQIGHCAQTASQARTHTDWETIVKSQKEAVFTFKLHIHERQVLLFMHVTSASVHSMLT